MGIGESPLASYLPHSPARGSGLAFLPPLALTLTFLAAPAASQAPDYVLEQHLTGYSRSGGCAVVGDLDGDGDRDVVSASYGKDQIIWYENRGGSPVEFGVPHVVSDTSIGQGPIILADVDGDGDPDIVSASRNDDLIVWYENLDGSNDFGAQRTITTRADGTCTIVAGDVDGDGDLDLASASEFDSKVAWYENLDGQGKFGDQQVIAVSLTMAVGCELADLDGDGDLDIVFSWFGVSALGRRALWYDQHWARTDRQNVVGKVAAEPRSQPGMPMMAHSDYRVSTITLCLDNCCLRPVDYNLLVNLKAFIVDLLS